MRILTVVILAVGLSASASAWGENKTSITNSASFIMGVMYDCCVTNGVAEVRSFPETVDVTCYSETTTNGLRVHTRLETFITTNWVDVTVTRPANTVFGNSNYGLFSTTITVHQKADTLNRRTECKLRWRGKEFRVMLSNETLPCAPVERDEIRQENNAILLSNPVGVNTAN
jgi:hypothetical protein